MIRSTFSGFNMSKLALMANQRALDVTGQNLSNINTSGYTRQRLDLASLNPVGNSISSSAFDSKVGQGVMMVGVSQIRDPFLDIQYRNEVPKVGTVEAKSSVLDRIGDIFDESSKEEIRSKLSSIITQLTNLATPDNAGSTSADSLVRSACEVLLDNIHQNGNAIENVRTELIDRMNQSVIPQINTYLEEIANLNVSIRNSQILGNPALELQDQRNLMIDELAKFMPIEVKYNSKDMGGGIKVDTLEINLRLNNGQTMDLIGKVRDDGVFDDTYRTHLLFKIDDTNGKGGLYCLDPYDPNAADPLNGPRTCVLGSHTDDAGVNTYYDLFDEGILKGNLDMLNKAETFDDPASDVKGIGYYQKHFDMFVNTFATMMNSLNTGTDANGNPIGGKLFDITDGSDTFTANNIKLSEDWINGTTKILLSKAENPGSTDYTNVLEMINALSSDGIKFGTSANGLKMDPATGRPNPEKLVFTGTFFECFNNIQNNQAMEMQANESLLKNHQTVADQVLDSRDAISGVNLDEEVMDLMRFSQSYNAASRLMTTLDELLERLIVNTGVVGR